MRHKKLVSYHRFVELMAGTLLPLWVYLSLRRGRTSGIAFVDRPPFQSVTTSRSEATRPLLAWPGKSTMGYFYGFKLHLVVNDQGQILAFCLTPGNVDDRGPVPILAQELWGKRVGDKGYISQALFDQLVGHDLQLISTARKNMKNRLMPFLDRVLAPKRSWIETINDQLKNISQIAHTRHRSPVNFLVNLLAGLIAYTWQPNKPALNLSSAELAQLPAVI